MLRTDFTEQMAEEKLHKVVCLKENLLNIPVGSFGLVVDYQVLSSGLWQNRYALEIEWNIVNVVSTMLAKVEYEKYLEEVESHPRLDIIVRRLYPQPKHPLPEYLLCE